MLGGPAAGLGGRAVVEAFLLGYQVDYRASVIVSPGHCGRGWHVTSTIGVLGAAAAASPILGLDAEQASNALAIASSTASGLRVNFGTYTKPLHAGIAARGGVQAAMINDMVGGQLQAGFQTPAVAAPFIATGHLSAFAVSGTEQIPSLMNVPTLAEAGVANLAVANWFGRLAPAGARRRLSSQWPARLLRESCLHP